MFRTLSTVAIAAVLLAATGGEGLAQNKCSSGKIKNAGKKAAAKLTCLSKGLSKGIAPDSTCVAKAEVKFSSVVAKAEAKVPNDCISTGDASAIEAKVDALVGDIDGLVDDPPSLSACDADKVKNAGKKAAAKLGCYSKALSKAAPLDSTCIAKAEVKFSSAAAKAEAKAASKALPCSATADAGAYESFVDAAVDDIVAELQLSCRRIVPDAAITNTYKQVSIAGPNLCSPNSPTVAMRLQPCSANGDCGGGPASGACFATPWVTVGPFAPQTSGVGNETKFTVTEGTYPACQHTACLTCGAVADCAAIKPGCDANPGMCFTTQCCSQPAFQLPALSVAGFCSRTFQVACGTGLVNTSDPQTGDNEVVKQADTSEPGDTVNCVYGGDPVKPCNTASGGQGADTLGRIVRTIGDGSNDAPGIHIRLLTPSVSTAWVDQDGCLPNATFDADEFTGQLQLALNTESSTAGATGSFADQNGDTCAFAGAGFGPSGAGPVVAPGPKPNAPAPYGTGGGYVTMSSSTIFSAGTPLFDVGFTAVTTNGGLSLEPFESCSCTPTSGCPE